MRSILKDSEILIDFKHRNEMTAFSMGQLRQSIEKDTNVVVDRKHRSVSIAENEDETG